jgi:hypothetical protein
VLLIWNLSSRQFLVVEVVLVADLALLISLETINKYGWILNAMHFNAKLIGIHNSCQSFMALDLEIG